MEETMKQIMEAMKASGKETFIFGGDKEAWRIFLAYAKNETVKKDCDCDCCDCKEKELESETANNRLYTVVINGNRDDELYTLKGAYERMKKYYCSHFEDMCEREFKNRYPIKNIVNGYDFEDDAYIDCYKLPKNYKYEN